MSGRTFTLTKTAEKVGVSTATINRWKKSGMLPSVKPVKIRGKYRFSPDDILRLRAFKDIGK